MKKQAGMRPLDLAILLKMVIWEETHFQYKDLSQDLIISASEVSESLRRSQAANLIDYSKKRVNKQNLFEFLVYGFKYVFPPQKGSVTVGVPTSTGHDFMLKKFSPTEIYVWPDFDGNARGIAVEPLYKKQVRAIRRDERLYKLLALLDVIRLEKVREVSAAVTELKKEILK